jgi:hypothetical protein
MTSTWLAVDGNQANVHASQEERKHTQVEQSMAVIQSSWPHQLTLLSPAYSSRQFYLNVYRLYIYIYIYIYMCVCVCVCVCVSVCLSVCSRLTL